MGQLPIQSLLFLKITVICPVFLGFSIPPSGKHSQAIQTCLPFPLVITERTYIMKHLVIFGTFITALLLLIWLNTEQSKGVENHDSYKMQLEVRARAIQKYGEYYD